MKLFDWGASGVSNFNEGSKQDWWVFLGTNLIGEKNVENMLIIVENEQKRLNETCVLKVQYLVFLLKWLLKHKEKQFYDSMH